MVAPEKTINHNQLITTIFVTSTHDADTNFCVEQTEKNCINKHSLTNSCMKEWKQESKNVPTIKIVNASSAVEAAAQFSH